MANYSIGPRTIGEKGSNLHFNQDHPFIVQGQTLHIYILCNPNTVYCMFDYSLCVHVMKIKIIQKN